ncbi:MAG TPA: hypothetical protein VIT65_22310 [Microlunatus sp.]
MSSWLSSSFFWQPMQVSNSGSKAYGSSSHCHRLVPHIEQRSAFSMTAALTRARSAGDHRRRYSS